MDFIYWVVIGLIGLIFLGVCLFLFWFIFIRGKIGVTFGKKVGANFIPKKKMNISAKQETIDYEKGTYVVDLTRLIDGRLYYEIGNHEALTLINGTKPNSELIAKILKTKIYSQIFEANEFTILGILTIVAVLIAVGISIYSVTILSTLQKDILTNRAMIENVTKLIQGQGVIIP